MATQIRGYKKQKLIRELALSGKTQQELADDYGVSQQAISYLSKRNAEEITKIQDDASDNFAGLWISDKHNRIAEYQQMVEDINDMPNPTVKDLSLKARILRLVAEECGGLSETTNVNLTEYRISNVDLEDMK